MGLMGLSLLRLKIRVEKAIVARSNWIKMAKVLINPQVPLPVPVDGDGSSSGAARGARRKPIGENNGGEGARGGGGLFGREKRNDEDGVDGEGRWR